MKICEAKCQMQPKRKDIVPPRFCCVFDSRKQDKKRSPIFIGLPFLAGETRFEHATNGFGDRCSTVEPLPYNLIKR